MKLSDAIALGRTLVTQSVPYSQDDGQGGGCALGMAARAANKKCLDFYAIMFLDPDFPVVDAVTHWPCKCPHDADLVGSTIAHVFNEHIHGDKTWTLDQLIDWVRSVEPAEAEQPERSEPCTCTPATDVETSLPVAARTGEQ